MSPTKRAGRHKHVPQRTCVGCRQVLPKRALVRLVRVAEGVQVDPSGKAPGRGAYLHEQRSCWQAALKGPLSRALQVELSPDVLRMLEDYANRLPDGDRA